MDGPVVRIVAVFASAAPVGLDLHLHLVVLVGCMSEFGCIALYLILSVTAGDGSR